MNDHSLYDPDRPMYYVLNPDHSVKPIERGEFGLIEWADMVGWRHRLIEQGNDPWQVGLDSLPNGYELSTVFLGLDHNYTFHGPAVLFETMLFGPDCADVLGRFATWGQAELAHQVFAHEYDALAAALEGTDAE